MKICGIICEYNPFHNGHLRQIKYLKEQLGYDFVVCVMSGNFSQRALPSIIDKYSRAESIDNSVDLICQIPTAYAVNNGEVFATAGIKLLNGLNVDSVCFGVETMDKELFFELSDILLNEPESYSLTLKSELKKGLSYKNAQLNSIRKCFKKGEIYVDLLSKPNNILALEYIKAIKRFNYNIEPILIERNSNFIDNTTSLNSTIKSATFIRNLIVNNGYYKDYIPEKSFISIRDNFYPIYMENYKKIAFNLLFNYDKEKMKNTYLVSEGLENKILSALIDSNDYDSLIKNIASKRYDINKINRIILNYILGINKNIINNLYVNEFSYCKVLRVNHTILKHLKPNLSLILRKNDITPEIQNNPIQIIENTATLLSKFIYNKEILYNDIFKKPIIY